VAQIRNVARQTIVSKYEYLQRTRWRGLIRHDFQALEIMHNRWVESYKNDRFLRRIERVFREITRFLLFFVLSFRRRPEGVQL
jgi:hypothetical protein